MLGRAFRFWSLVTSSQGPETYEKGVCLVFNAMQCYMRLVRCEL